MEDLHFANMVQYEATMQQEKANRMAQTIDHETSQDIHNNSITENPVGERLKTMIVGSPTNSLKNVGVVQYHPLR